jgi:hypothetical protein
MAGETEVLGENLPQRQFIHHKSHMTRSGFEPGPPRWEASDQSLELWRGLTTINTNISKSDTYFYAQPTEVLGPISSATPIFSYGAEGAQSI